jgi:hypothetical protein
MRRRSLPTVARKRRAGASSVPTTRHSSALRRVEVLGSLAAVLTAGVVLWNEVLKPGAPLAVIRAQVKDVEVHVGRSLRVFLNSHPGQLSRFLEGGRANRLTPAEIRDVLDTRGVLAEYSLSATGRRGETLDVTQILYNARTEARVPPGSVELVGPERYTTKATSYRSSRAIWLALPPGQGKYFLEIDIVEPGGETLAVGKSRVFETR